MTHRRLSFWILGLLLLHAGCGGRGEPAWRLTRGPEPAAEPAPGAPDVLLVLVDSLRPDHLGCYGYSRATSPNLDRWAGGATLFGRAYTQGTQTRIAVASLFTGTLPTLHRIRDVDLRGDAVAGASDSDGLAPSLETLAEAFRRAGYLTWGASTNPHVSPQYGFHRGFAQWQQTDSRNGRDVLDRFLRWNGHQDGERSGRPRFVYLHLMDVHRPYAPPPPWIGHFEPHEGLAVYPHDRRIPTPWELAATLARYDDAVRYADSLLGEILRGWEGGGTRPRVTAVISDHGEEFLEHGGLGHGTTVFEEQARIVLLLKSPGAVGGRVSDPVAIVDLHRWLLDLAGMPPPDGAKGRPADSWRLLPAPLYTESRAGWIGVRDSGRLLVHLRERPEDAVWYDLGTDPRESRPRRDPDVLAALHVLRRRLVEGDAESAMRLSTPSRVRDDAESIRELRALGYVSPP